VKFSLEHAELRHSGLDCLAASFEGYRQSAVQIANNSGTCG
jgi:hypothetical protein